MSENILSFIGTLITSTQPSIESVGILNSLTVSGVSTFGNISSNSIVLSSPDIGLNAGSVNQNTFAVAIGNNAGRTNQGTNSIAIGYLAGQTDQNQSTIVLNASGSVINTTTNNAFFVHPIRYQTSSTMNSLPLTYNTTTREIISSNQLNLGATNFSIDSNVLFVDATNNYVGINQASPTLAFQSTGQTHQIGTLVFSNNAAATEVGIRTVLNYATANQLFIFRNNASDRISLYNQGWTILNFLASTHPSSQNGIYAYTGNLFYLGSNNGSLYFRNTSIDSNVLEVNNVGDVFSPNTSVIHTTQTSNQNIGYANTQTTGTVTSLFGSFRRTSRGYITITNGSANYEFVYRDGTTNDNALFFPNSIDNVGGVLNVYLKKLNSNSTTQSAIGVYRVLIAKRGGATLASSIKVAGSLGNGFTTNPTFGGGTTDIIRLNFNTTDTTSPNVMYLCWSFEGFV